MAYQTKGTIINPFIMKLSIITVNYNNCAGLVKTIESVKSQTFKDYEWIIIDGGSTDGSKEILDSNSALFSYYVSEPDEGIYNAMNKGISHAVGEYCQFLNSGDSFIDSQVLSHVFSDNNLTDVNYGDQWCSQNGVIIEKRTYPDEMNLTYIFRAPLGHQASFVKTDVVKSHLYNEKYNISADRAFFLGMYIDGCIFHHIKLPIVYFDTDGIGSNSKTILERQKQFYGIKREYFSNQVVKDIERLLSEEDEYLFVRRVKPLNFVYGLFKLLQTLKNRI